MKLVDYLTLDSPVSRRLLVIGGDDAVGRDVGVRAFERVHQLDPAVREYHRVTDGRQVIDLWTEESLLGDRYLFLTAQKIKNTVALRDFLNHPSPSGDRLVLLCDGSLPVDPHRGSPGVVVECVEPKTAKDRQKWLEARQLGWSAEVVTFLAERTTSSAQLEQTILTLQLLEQVGTSPSVNLVGHLLNVPEPLKDTARALLRGNVPRLTREVDQAEPFPLLGLWYATLWRFYLWLVQDYDEESDKKNKTTNYLLKDYKIAKQRYSPAHVRSFLDNINLIYQDLRKGKDYDWRERAKIALRMFCHST